MIFIIEEIIQKLSSEITHDNNKNKEHGVSNSTKPNIKSAWCPTLQTISIKRKNKKQKKKQSA